MKHTLAKVWDENLEYSPRCKCDYCADLRRAMQDLAEDDDPDSAPYVLTPKGWAEAQRQSSVVVSVTGAFPGR